MKTINLERGRERRRTDKCSNNLCMYSRCERLLFSLVRFSFCRVWLNAEHHRTGQRQPRFSQKFARRTSREWNGRRRKKCVVWMDAGRNKCWICCGILFFFQFISLLFFRCFFFCYMRFVVTFVYVRARCRFTAVFKISSPIGLFARQHRNRDGAANRGWNLVSVILLYAFNRAISFYSRFLLLIFVIHCNSYTYTAFTQTKLDSGLCCGRLRLTSAVRKKIAPTNRRLKFPYWRFHQSRRIEIPVQRWQSQDE